MELILDKGCFKHLIICYGDKGEEGYIHSVIRYGEGEEGYIHIVIRYGAQEIVLAMPPMEDI